MTALDTAEDVGTVWLTLLDLSPLAAPPSRHLAFEGYGSTAQTARVHAALAQILFDGNDLLRSGHELGTPWRSHEAAIFEAEFRPGFLGPCLERLGPASAAEAASLLWSSTRIPVDKLDPPQARCDPRWITQHPSVFTAMVAGDGTADAATIGATWALLHVAALPFGGQSDHAAALDVVDEIGGGGRPDVSAELQRVAVALDAMLTACAGAFRDSGITHAIEGHDPNAWTAWALAEVTAAPAGAAYADELALPDLMVTDATTGAELLAQALVTLRLLEAAFDSTPGDAANDPRALLHSARTVTGLVTGLL